MKKKTYLFRNLHDNMCTCHGDVGYIYVLFIRERVKKRKDLIVKTITYDVFVVF